MTERDRRIAVVTGASRGIGEAIARGLAQHGLFVIVAARDARSGQKVAAELGRAAFHPLDVTSDESVSRLAQDIEREHGGVDVLVDNAGASFDGFDATVAARTLDVNFRGAVRVTDRLLPQLRAGARIVMVSSGMGELAGLPPPLRKAFADPALDRAPLFALTERFVADVAKGLHAENGWPSNAYRVSKIAMNAYVRILARELASDPRRILVNAACPGWVRTRMGGPSAPRSPAEGARTPIWLALLPDGGPSGGFFRDERRIDW